MYNFSYSSSSHYAAQIFFVLIVLCAALFTVNLILAQILDSFNHQHTLQETKRLQEEDQDRIR